MAQGELKKAKPASKKSNVLKPKKGARVIAPKKANLIRQKKITKVRKRKFPVKVQFHPGLEGDLASSDLTCLSKWTSRATRGIQVGKTLAGSCAEYSFLIFPSL
ncbi:hypothetical protein GX51_00725 [Blastomyces parvus]|uniref:Uncharacterized protein n=1 Tax=Blastomyces parvus TaxID=2060905 RepID=A0A2B7XKH1_9EURO|nr:hypothetical protein GX51_00725 [Blastomyces parvus]